MTPPLVTPQEPGSVCACNCHKLGVATPHMGYPCGCKPKNSQLELHQLFGDDVIFFPKVATDKPGHVEWRDAHVCKDCGSMATLPYEHLTFHRRLQEAS